MATLEGTTRFTRVSAAKLRNHAIELASQENKARFKLAEIIYNIYYGTVEMGGSEMELWRAWGYDEWFDYVETEIGLHITTAAGYRDVHRVFEVTLGGAWDRGIVVSFTKMKALAEVVTKENVNAWLKKAKGMTCCALEEAVMEELHGSRPSKPSRNFSAKLTDNQMAKINSVLELAYGEFEEQGVTTRGEALIKILEQWSAVVKKRPKLKKAG